MKYTDPHRNVCTHLVECSKVISDFFADSNKINSHNQARQFELGLEKSLGDARSVLSLGYDSLGHQCS